MSRKHRASASRSPTNVWSSFRSWRDLRSHLFGSNHPLATMVSKWLFRALQALLTNTQPSNKPFDIIVTADGQEEDVDLTAIVDERLPNSLIRQNVVALTRGSAKPMSSLERFEDSIGRSYESCSSIELRWVQRGGTQTCDETFWIVDYCAVDVVLRRHISDDSGPGVHPLAWGAQSQGKKARYRKV